jgi:hypothetical protein
MHGLGIIIFSTTSLHLAMGKGGMLIEAIR